MLWFTRHTWKLPLRVVLVVPFVLEVVVAVGLTGYLSYRNGQQAVNNLATQLVQEKSDRIHYRLNNYLSIPPRMAQTTENMVEIGLLNLTDFRRTGQYFVKQRQPFPEVSSVGFSRPNGDFVGTYSASQEPVIALFQKALGNRVATFTTDRSGNPQQPIPSQRVGREDAVSNRGDSPTPRWGEILYQPDSQTYAISFQFPVYSRDRYLSGTLHIQQDLQYISNFLNQLKGNHAGTLFIVDRTGQLVVGSGEKPTYKLKQGKLHRLKAFDSGDDQIADISRDLTNRFGSIQNLATQPLSLSMNGHDYFVQVTPYRDQFGLDWTIVVAVAESDFMAEIDRNTRNTLGLCALALIGAIALGWFTAQWIAQPILRLSRASRALTLGEWDELAYESNKITELEILARSFNQMTEQLQQSFDQVKTALEESKEKFTKIFQASPDAINILTIGETKYLDVNESFLEVTGYSREEVIGHTAYELKLIANMEQVQQFRHLLETNQAIRNLEFDFVTKSGQIRTALLSSEVIELDGQRCILSVSRDITDRKQLELALQRSEAKLKDVLNSANVGICAFHLYPDNSVQYEFLSAGHALIFGYSAEELLANPDLWHSHVHPEDLKNVIFPAYKKLLKHNATSIEYRFWHKDGSLRWISDHLTARWDEVVDCLVVTAAAIDRTARKQAEAALHETYSALSQQLRQITDTLPVYISYLDNQQRYQFINQLYETRFGWSREKFYGKHIQEVLGEETYQRIQPHLEFTLAGHLTTYTIKQADHQGILCLLDVTLVPDFDSSSQVKGCYVLCVDKTAQKGPEGGLR